jgi:hypothetical protein
MFGSWFKGECHLEDSKESFLADSNESFFKWLIDINNLFLRDVDNLVESCDLSSQNLCNPECTVHQFLSCFDGDSFLVFSEEEGESSGDVFS